MCQCDCAHTLYTKTATISKIDRAIGRPHSQKAHTARKDNSTTQLPKFEVRELLYEQEDGQTVSRCKTWLGTLKRYSKLLNLQYVF